MKCFLRVMLFVLVAGLSIGPAIIGCDDDSKNDNIGLMALPFLNSYKPDKIYIYTGIQNDGDMGSRKAANSLCRTAAAGFPALAGKKYKKAFLSFSATDQIKDLVSAEYGTLPVYGLVSAGTETSLQTTWNDLWTGSGISATMEAATDVNNYYWSGSNSNGTYIDDAHSCNGWTASSSDSHEYYGASGQRDVTTNPQWIYFGTLDCNNTNAYVMCVAY